MGGAIKIVVKTHLRKANTQFIHSFIDTFQNKQTTIFRRDSAKSYA